MANTPNYNLYKPSRNDSNVEVDTSLSDNFMKIDTELQNNKGGLTAHINDANAHTSDKITHADGSVKTMLDNHEQQLGDLQTETASLDGRVTDIETLGLEVLAPNLEGRIQTIESDVEGFLAPATFDSMDKQGYTFDEYRLGYVENRVGPLEMSLADIVTVASKFNILPTNIDNHDNFISAFEYLKAQGGGTLQLPAGTFKTSPISFNGYDNIVIKGVGRSYPGKINTTIKIVGINPAGSVGLQFAETTNPYVSSEWKAKFCKVEGIFLDCDNKCDIGINGNRGLDLKDVTIRNAVKDGIVLEDYTYPVYLTNVESSFNGRHGLYARGKMSTCYYADKSEFNSNGGYGIVLEGGSAINISNCLAQSNVIGGLKINKVAGYSGSYFLNELNFINFYTEANGTLAVEHPSYEGNYAVFITGYDKSNSSNGKPWNIRMSGCKINASGTGKALKIDSVRGCLIDSTITGGCDIASVGVYGLEFRREATSATNPAIGTGLGVTSYQRTSPFGIVYNCGLFYTRGRMLVYEFYLDTITAGATVSMNTLRQAFTAMTLAKGYDVFKDGSILGIKVSKKSVTGSVGTITVKPTYATATALTADPASWFSGTPSVVLDLSTGNTTKAEYEPGTYNFSANNVLGMKLIASSDYVCGSHDGFVVQLMIEI